MSWRHSQAMKVQIAPTVPNANTTAKLSKFAIKEEAPPELPLDDVDDEPPPVPLGTKVAEGLERHDRAAAAALPDALDAVLTVALPEKLQACGLRLCDS